MNPSAGTFSKWFRSVSDHWHHPGSLLEQHAFQVLPRPTDLEWGRGELGTRPQVVLTLTCGHAGLWKISKKSAEPTVLGERSLTLLGSNWNHEANWGCCRGGMVLISDSPTAACSRMTWKAC